MENQSSMIRVRKPMGRAGPSLEEAEAELVRLTTPSVLGLYTHFDETEIFAILDGQKTPFNIFSILVAEERSGVADCFRSRSSFFWSRQRL